MNFARLNHILIPSTKTGRDRFRTSRFGRAMLPLVRIFFALTEEGRFLAVFMLIAGAFGLEVRVHDSYLLWCGVMGLLIAPFLFRRFYAMRDVELTLEHPARVGVGERLRIELILTNRGTSAHRALRVDGPLLPWDGAYSGDSPTLRLLEPGATGRLIVELTFSHRGEHHLDPFRVAALVPLGIAVGPPLSTKGVYFLVLPKIAKVARFDPPTGIRYHPGGVSLASHTGEAREIVGIRPYRAGDPVRDIHHRAWARLGFPVVREYQQEYFTRFGIVVDTESRDDDRALEAAVSLASGVLAHLSRGEALIDLLLVGDELHRLTLGRSLGFLEQGLDLLSVVEPSHRFDGSKAAALLSTHLDRLSSVVIIALKWDEERRAVAEMVRRRGVGCRVLVVGEKVAEPGVISVDFDRIEGGEALEL